MMDEKTWNVKTEHEISYDANQGWVRRKMINEGYESFWTLKDDGSESKSNCPVSSCKLMDKTCSSDLENSNVWLGKSDMSTFKIDN